jgi:hypothetical protein
MKPFQYTLVIIAALLATAASSRTVTPRPSHSDISHATDGAYRDGLFIGHLDRSRGQRHHLASGRWNNSTDRQSFVAGYEQGYSQVIQN